MADLRPAVGGNGLSSHRPRGAGPPSGTHAISFYCDDIHAAVAELRAKGVEFVDEVRDAGYGLTIHFRVPGDFVLELYQPHYRK